MKRHWEYREYELPAPTAAEWRLWKFAGFMMITGAMWAFWHM